MSVHVTGSVIVAAQELLRRADILSTALQHGGTVFGGYLRDFVSRMELPHSDVDIWFPDKGPAKDFVFALLECCDVNLTKRHKKDYYRYGGREAFEHYRAYSPDFETYIDIIISDEIHPEGGADVDINAFVFDKDGLRINSPPGMQLDPATVIQHAQTGLFQPLPGCPRYRFERMMKKGWTPVEGQSSLMQMAARIAGP